MLDARCHGCLMLDATGHCPLMLDASHTHRRLCTWLLFTGYRLCRIQEPPGIIHDLTEPLFIWFGKGKHQTEGTPTTGLGVARGARWWGQNWARPWFRAPSAGSKSDFFNRSALLIVLHVLIENVRFPVSKQPHFLNQKTIVLAWLKSCKFRWIISEESQEYVRTIFVIL